MANPYPLNAASLVVGEPGSGKSYWTFQDFINNTNLSIYIDYTGNTYRDFKEQIAKFYLRGSWAKVKKFFVQALKTYRKVVYNPACDEDIHEMSEWLWSVKQKHYDNTQEVWIYYDEIDMCSDRKAMVERMFTKGRGCGVRPVGIAQRLSALQNRNIVDNAYGCIVFFRIEPQERENIAVLYQKVMSDEDYQHIEQFKSYNAVVYDCQKHEWVRI